MRDLSKLRMDPQQEMLDILNRVWVKLQALPQAGALEVGAFAVLLIFVGKDDFGISELHLWDIYSSVFSFLLSVFSVQQCFWS